MLKRIGRHPLVLSAIGSLLAGYLKLVYYTNRFTIEPVTIHEDTDKDLPVIVAMWHGQHFMVPFAKPSHWPAKVMISKSADGEINAIAARKLGMGLIRASGGRTAHQIKKRGGMRGFIEAVRALKDGYSIAMTADVPKGSRTALRCWYCAACQTLRTADLAGRGGHEPQHRAEQLGQGECQFALWPRRYRWR
jgi:lysophospholipid acyltransferase (LPLAT)-like uncharacterized protein